jgi:hypothetical protein
MVKHCPIEVGLGLKVTIEDDTADASLDGDIVEAGGSESAVGKGACGSGQDLLPARCPA